MNGKRVIICLFIGLAIFLAGQAPAFAQATRTWVSGVGDDANPCSRTAPCKTFAGAISKTAAGGIINVLDPAGAGALTITKSITVDASESYGSTLAPVGLTGINVIAGAEDKVVLRGITIEGTGTGARGIRLYTGKELYIENCTIQGFAQAGIIFEPQAASSLYVTDTIVRNNSSANTSLGISIKPASTGTAKAVLDGCRIEGNWHGLRAENVSTVTIRNSVVAGSAANGIQALTGTGATEITIEDSLISSNGFSGVVSKGASSTVRLSNVTINNNVNGISTGGTSGKIQSFGNNKIAGNQVDGEPTETLLMK